MKSAQRSKIEVIRLSRRRTFAFLSSDYQEPPIVAPKQRPLPAG
jgi:hypothetical protein